MSFCGDKHSLMFIWRPGGQEGHVWGISFPFVPPPDCFQAAGRVYSPALSAGSGVVSVGVGYIVATVDLSLPLYIGERPMSCIDRAPVFGGCSG